MSFRPIQDLTTTALHAHRAFRAAQVPYMIVGGAAVRFMGGERLTKDVDVNVRALGNTSQTLQDEGFMPRWIRDEGFQAKPVGEGRSHLPKLDIKAQPHLWPTIQRYISKTRQGICHGSESVIALMKVASVADRGSNNARKITSDLEDLEFLLSKLREASGIVPRELQLLFLPEETVWEAFWTRTKDVGGAEMVDGLRRLFNAVQLSSNRYGKRKKSRRS